MALEIPLRKSKLGQKSRSFIGPSIIFIINFIVITIIIIIIIIIIVIFILNIITANITVLLFESLSLLLNLSFPSVGKVFRGTLKEIRA